MNLNGELGIGSSTTLVEYPTGVLGLWHVATVDTSGESHSCALTLDGDVECWGEAIYGATGTGDKPIGQWTSKDMYNGVKVFFTSPQSVVDLPTGNRAITLGKRHTCALTFTGVVKCWGENSRGQLGSHTKGGAISVPKDVIGLKAGARAITAGGEHTCALTASGGVKCWGSNSRGQLGNNTTINSGFPSDVTGLPNGVVAISAGARHTCAITAAGEVKCWGSNKFGQLGNGTRTNSKRPVNVVGLKSQVVAISSGDTHTCALTTERDVVCWGSNRSGELGNGATKNSSVPVVVVGLHPQP